MYLDKYTNSIQRLCENHKVRNLYVFGSVIRSDFSDNSDIDFIVDFDTNDPLEYADSYFAFKFALQDLLDRPIDLLEERGLRNTYIKSSINSSKKLIYEA